MELIKLNELAAKGEPWEYRGYTVKYADGPNSDTEVYAPNGEYKGMHYNVTAAIDRMIAECEIEAFAAFSNS